MPQISMNAWTGSSNRAPESPLGGNAMAWLMHEAGRPDERTLAPTAPPDWNAWQGDRVGWGLVVANPDGFSNQDLANGADLAADTPLQTLLEERRSKQGSVPVFHYDAGAGDGHGQVFLRNYAAGKDLDLTSDIGLADDRLPFYLLIYASPNDIPWDFQYLLQVRHAVGRIDPAMQGIEHYFTALTKKWETAGAASCRTLTWAVDHGPDDITHLMRNVVAEKLHAKFRSDPDIADNAIFLDGTSVGADARGAALIAALESHQPGIVVTSSHGRTGPLNNQQALVANLGVPVDQDHRDLDLAGLFADWRPDGAIWIAQACCSAGSCGPSQYAGLFNPGTEIGDVLSAIAAAGNHIAPLPQLLLGNEKPARAFFGHVEPTFNLTLQQPETGQPLTGPLTKAFYDSMLQPLSVGRVLIDYRKVASTKHRQWQKLVRLKEQGENVTQRLLYARTTAIDIDSLVLIGDPTAMLSPL